MLGGVRFGDLETSESLAFCDSEVLCCLSCDSDYNGPVTKSEPGDGVV